MFPIEYEDDIKDEYDPGMTAYPHIRRFMDLLILAAIAASLLVMLPKLHGLANKVVETHGEELSALEQAQAHHGVFLVGLLVLAGAITMVLPCHSWFATPAVKRRRMILGITCMVPLLVAVLGLRMGPPYMNATFMRLGVLCSLGVWAFALPIVVQNRSLADVIGGLRGSSPNRR